MNGDGENLPASVRDVKQISPVAATAYERPTSSHVAANLNGVTNSGAADVPCMARADGDRAGVKQPGALVATCTARAGDVGVRASGGSISRKGVNSARPTLGWAAGRSGVGPISPGKPGDASGGRQWFAKDAFKTGHGTQPICTQPDPVLAGDTNGHQQPVRRLPPCIRLVRIRKINGQEVLLTDEILRDAEQIAAFYREKEKRRCAAWRTKRDGAAASLGGAPKEAGRERGSKRKFGSSAVVDLPMKPEPDCQGPGGWSVPRLAEELPQAKKQKVDFRLPRICFIQRASADGSCGKRPRVCRTWQRFQRMQKHAPLCPSPVSGPLLIILVFKARDFSRVKNRLRFDVDVGALWLNSRWCTSDRTGPDPT